MSMSLGDRLKALREAAQLSGEKLGESVGVSKQTISHWEKGRYEPNVEQIGQLCSRLRSSADWLVLGVRPGAPSQETTPFRDLTAFETQLVTLFRLLKGDEQHAVLVSLNDMIPGTAKASSADPFAMKSKRGVRGKSRLGELQDIDMPKKGAA